MGRVRQPGGSRSPERASRAAAAWIGIVALASVVDPAAVGTVLGGGTETAATPAIDRPLGVDAFTLAHLLAYGVLAWLVGDGLRGTAPSGSLRTACLAVAVATAVGGGIELLQTGVAARTGSVADAAVNAVGATAGVVARWVFRRGGGAERRA